MLASCSTLCREVCDSHVVLLFASVHPPHTRAPLPCWWASGDVAGPGSDLGVTAVKIMINVSYPCSAFSLFSFFLLFIIF